MLLAELAGGVQQDGGAAVFREAENPSADGGQGDALATPLVGSLQAVMDSAAQQRIGAFGRMLTPNGTDGVDDELGGQVASTRDGDFARRDGTVLAHPFVAFPLDDFPAFSDDGSRHAPTVLKVRIGGVDDGVHLLLRDVAPNDADDLPRRQRRFSCDFTHANHPYTLAFCHPASALVCISVTHRLPVRYFGIRHPTQCQGRYNVGGGDGDEGTAVCRLGTVGVGGSA